MNTHNSSLITTNSSEKPLKDPKDILSFLYASITDAQAAIRAIDTKLSINLVMLSIALTKGDILLAIYKAASNKNHSLCIVVTTLFILAWMAGMWSTFMGLAAIDNPTAHICKMSAKGTFYSGGIFKPKFVDSFFNRRPGSKSDFGIHRDSLPQNAEEAIDELALEQMKLTYIRSIKIQRCNVSYRCTALALLIMIITSFATCF